MEKKKIIAILGPTAVGKTKLTVDLAKSLNCEIISADARQFYKELSIGTAKPAKNEMQGITHHFINSHSITEPLNASAFENEFLDLIENSNAKVFVLTGGSGLFVKAALEGLQPIPSDQGVQEQLQNEFKTQGLNPLLEELEKVDPATCAKVDKENPHRVLRAIEVYRISGKPMSWWIDNSKAIKRPFESQVFILERERDELYNRINSRVVQMIDQGLEKEAEALQQYKELQPMRTVGYQEWWPYFEGKESEEEVIQKIQQNSRRYAKRQMTWLRGQVKNDVCKVYCTGKSEQKILEEIHQQI